MGECGQLLLQNYVEPTFTVYKFTNIKKNKTGKTVLFYKMLDFWSNMENC